MNTKTMKLVSFCLMSFAGMNLAFGQDIPPPPPKPEAPAAPKAAPAPPAPPASLPLAEGEVFKVVEQMPRFPGCESEDLNEREKQSCSTEKMMEYIMSNISYPEEAKKSGVEGTVVIQFNVEKDGSLSHIKVVKDIGFGCGQAAMEVVKSMNEMSEKWTPGYQRGLPVVVQYALPVKFSMSSDEK